MKSTGVVRKVDELGRIVLPVEFRRTLEIADKDKVEMSLEGDVILLRKHAEACVLCADMKNLRVFKNKTICAQCIEELMREG